MRDDQIAQVAKVLEEWNPLGDEANTVEQLEGYRYEAMDIISTINILPGPITVEKAIKQVLTQAFNIELNQAMLAKAAKEIECVLNAK